MTHHDLEDIYAALALQIDAVGKENSELFLAKLVVLLAHRNGNPVDVQQCINGAAASLNLPDTPA
jgi:hypothetical protein